MLPTLITTQGQLERLVARHPDIRLRYVLVVNPRHPPESERAVVEILKRYLEECRDKTIEIQGPNRLDRNEENRRTSSETGHDVFRW